MQIAFNFEGRRTLRAGVSYRAVDLFHFRAYHVTVGVYVTLENRRKSRQETPTTSKPYVKLNKHSRRAIRLRHPRIFRRQACFSRRIRRRWLIENSSNEIHRTGRYISSYFLIYIQLANVPTSGTRNANFSVLRFLARTTSFPVYLSSQRNRIDHLENKFVPKKFKSFLWRRITVRGISYEFHNLSGLL